MSEASDKANQPSASKLDELFELIVESAVEYAIFTTDLNGTVTSWNHGAERLFGYTEAEAMGSSADVVFLPEDQAGGTPQAERSKALLTGRAEDERWHKRKDGSRFWASGLMMQLRSAAGFVKITRDRTAQHLAEQRVQENEERFRLLATSIPQLVFRTLPDGNRTWGSPQWIDFTGLNLDESLGLGWLDAVHPDDRVVTQNSWDQAREKGEYYVEHRIRRKADGEYRWHQTRARPVNASNSLSGDWVGTMTDVHDLRGLKDRQQVMMAELQHRTRNLLAVVQAIARQTIRATHSPDAFGTEFENRLRALGRVQSLLARVDYHDVDLRLLLEAELAALGGHEKSPKITIGGPPVALPPTSAQALGLALHELATNAVKHGALAQQPSGKLSVTWEIEAGGPERQVLLEWRESGVSIPNGPSRQKGYGSELIERALPYQLKAKTKLEFKPDGVRCSIAVPIGARGTETRRESPSG